MKYALRAEIKTYLQTLSSEEERQIYLNNMQNQFILRYNNANDVENKTDILQKIYAINSVIQNSKLSSLIVERKNINASDSCLILESQSPIKNVDLKDNNISQIQSIIKEKMKDLKQNIPITPIPIKK